MFFLNHFLQIPQIEAINLPSLELSDALGKALGKDGEALFPLFVVPLHVLSFLR